MLRSESAETSLPKYDKMLRFAQHDTDKFSTFIVLLQCKTILNANDYEVNQYLKAA